MPIEKPSRREGASSDTSPRTPTSPGSNKPVRFGPYWLESRIAVGGTAEVYLARPALAAGAPTFAATPSLPAPSAAPSSDRVVVKRLLPQFVNDPDGRTMFEREAKLHAAVQHENVVTVFGSGMSDDGEPYLAMEYIDGVDCFRLLRRLTQGNRTLSAGIATFIAREVLRGLSSVHSARDEKGQPIGIIHRDVTPSNIYLSKAGGVKLGDFGIARSSSRATVKTADGTMLKGKFAYLAPEQVAGEAFDHRADLFSLAAVLVEMLIGKPLFSGSGQLSVLLAIRDCRLDPIIEAKERLPHGMFELLVKALARTPAGRFQSAGAFATALLPFEIEGDKARAELSEVVAWAQTSTSTTAMAAVRESLRSGLRSGPPPIPSRAPFAPRPGAGDWGSGLSGFSPSLTPGAAPAPSPARTVTLQSAVAAAKAPPLHPTTPSAQHVDEVTLDLEPDPDTGGSSATLPHHGHLRMPEGDHGLDPHSQTTGEYSRLPSYVETTRGERHGPWSYARLVEQLAIGAIGRGDKVDYMGRGLRPVEEVEELARFIPAKTATTHPVSGLGVPDTSEDLAQVGILVVLIRVLASKETGVLFVERPSTDATEAGRKELYFRDGKLHHVASSNAGELLGQYLVRRSMLSRDELEFALAVLPRYGGRIGDTLISLGLVSAVDMFRAIREQGRDRVADLFHWQCGRSAFYRHQIAPHVEFPLELDIPSLVLAGLESALPGDDAVAKYRDHFDDTLVPLGPAENGAGLAPTLTPERAVTSHFAHAHWPPTVARAIKLAATPMRLGDHVTEATREGAASPADALRAVEILIAAQIAALRRVPASR